MPSRRCALGSGTRCSFYALAELSYESRHRARRADRNVVDRYLTFEYLRRTEANLALADIRAQHPNATVVDWSVPEND